MVHTLEGGCFVKELFDGPPTTLGTVSRWRVIGREHGSQAISLYAWQFAPGKSPWLRNPSCEEVWYVLRGRGHMMMNGTVAELSPDSGVYVAPGAVVCVDNPGPDDLVILGSRCPEPESNLASEQSEPSAHQEPEPGAPLPLIRLSDRRKVPTADRWYRVLVDKELGSQLVTQFVGAIPPSRAPDHFHEYEEVICILTGTGRMWAGETNTAIGPGSCIFLPRKQLHCVENLGPGEMRLLGTFYPAGSPAIRYEAEDTA